MYQIKIRFDKQTLTGFGRPEPTGLCRSNPSSRMAKIKSPDLLSQEGYLSWLGRQYDNGTFTDEDLQKLDDIEEIEKLLIDESKDEPCSELHDFSIPRT